MRSGKRAALALGLIAVAMAGALGGCADLGYLSGQLGGHLRLMHAARPVPEWLADANTPPTLRERLLLTQRMRDFAVRELHLPDNASYRSYADLHREAAVWNVVAAPTLSLTPRSWCFPVMGCVAYRGYFDEKRAQALGTELRGQGFDVLVYPVPAYSSLGWTADPLLNTFIDYNDSALAGMIFHELAHQVAYAQDDTAFNEAFATAVERIGVRVWLAGSGTPTQLEQYERSQARSARFRALTLDYQARLKALYAGDEPDKATAKAALFASMRADYARIKSDEWGGYAGYDRWFAEANNASFALLASYNELVPFFERLFAAEGHDWSRFYAEVKRRAALPKPERLTSAIR
ncbi:aminopeptidase [Burkholderiaceae bacterium UC74_6]